MLSQHGFRKVLGTQCTYYHPDLKMYVVAHVDDFLILGVRSDMDGFVKGLVDDGYECTSEILGFREDEVQSMKFLGRKILLTNEGLEWEGDARHSEAFLSKLAAEFCGGREEYEQEDGSSEARRRAAEMTPVATPAVKRPDDEEVGDQEVLPKAQAKAYRGLAALANFMAQDRGDLGFAAKENLEIDGESKGRGYRPA